METGELSMTADNTPDAVEPPAEIVSAVARSMRGATIENPEEVKVAREVYLRQQRAADEIARQRREQIEAQRRVDEASRQRLAEREAKAQRSAAIT